MMSSSACSSSTPSLAVSNTTARTSVSAVPTKMTPPLQTAPAFSPADTELAASPAYTASSTTYPITYPSVPMRLSSPVSVSPQRSLTRSPRRTTTPHRAHGSDATSATLVSPSEKSVDNGLSTLHEAFASTTRPGTAPSENCQRRPKEEERGFQSIFPDYDPDLPLTRQHCQPAYKPAVYQKAPSSSARDFATGPRSRTPKMSSSSTMSRSPGFPQKTAVIAEQEIPTFAPPPMKPLRGSVKRKEKKGKDGSKSFTFMQRSDSVGPVKDKPARARLVKKSRPTTTTCNATSTASSSSKVATSTGQTISSPVMTITNTQVEDIDQQTQRSSTDTKTTSQRPTFSLTPATDPKPKGYEPSNAGTMSLVQPVRQYIPVPGGKLQPLPEGHKYAEEQQMVVHGVTVALGALAFVAGVGVEMGAGVLGKVGKRV
ncbi:MAG: hypothetical protein M1828_002519 [Chrysothrix sp. TS-e1954]|nr:MAG: hypothetical protein M1828_002519 [Chrysothrix sp. TS-e1954]